MTDSNKLTIKGASSKNEKSSMISIGQNIKTHSKNFLNWTNIAHPNLNNPLEIQDTQQKFKEN